MKEKLVNVAERYGSAVEHLKTNQEIDLWHCAVLDELSSLLGNKSYLVNELRDSFSYEKDQLKRSMDLLLMFSKEQ